jgi:hypothetical protein
MGAPYQGVSFGQKTRRALKLAPNWSRSAWLTQRSKGDSDRDVAVIAQWEKLTAALSARISDVESQLAQVRSAHAAEIDELRRTHRTEIDEMRKTHRVEMRAMRELNEGLQRMIAQDSQSTAHLLGDIQKDVGSGK